MFKTKLSSILVGLAFIAIVLPFALTIRQNPVQSFTDFFISGAHNSLSAVYGWSTSSYGSNNTGSIWRLLPLSLFYTASTNLAHISSGVAQLLVCVALFSIGFTGFVKLAPRLLYAYDMNQIVTYIAATFFVFNTYVLIQLTSSFLLIIPYMLLPLQIILLCKAFESGKIGVYAVSSGFLAASYLGVNLIFDVITFLALLVVSYVTLSRGRGIRTLSLLKFFIIFYGVTLALSAFWLVPQLYSALTDPATSTYVLKSEQFYNSDSSVLRVLRGLGEWSFFSGQNGIPYNSFSTAYKTNAAVIAAGFVPLLLAIVAFLQYNHHKLRKGVILLSAALLLILIAIIGTYPSFPTAVLVQLIFNNVPFAMAFRNTYKFALLEMLVLSLLMILALSRPFNAKYKYHRLIKPAIGLVVLAAIVINVFPFFTAQIYSKGSQINSIPNYWRQAASYLNQGEQGRYSIFMLPNQYFEAFQWNGMFKAFPRNLEDTLFKAPTVHNTCKGCGEYLTANYLSYIYNNLAEPGIFKLLAMTGNATVVQRNDYDSEYYNVETPNQIKHLLSSNRLVIKQKAFGKLDVYSIKPDTVNPLIYSPKKIVATNQLSQVAPIADNNNRSTAIALTTSLPTSDQKTLAVSNYYQSVFNVSNTTVANHYARSTLYLPKASNYTLANTNSSGTYKLSYSAASGVYNLKFELVTNAVKANDKSITQHDNQAANVDLGNYGGAPVVITLQQHSFVLHPDGSNSDLGSYALNPSDDTISVYSTQNKGINLAPNGSLESGLWQPKVQDCNQTTSSPQLSMKLTVGQASAGNKALLLSAKQDTACTYTPPLKNFTAGTYYFQFDAKRVIGGNPSYCVWNGISCVSYAKLGSSTDWTTYSGAAYLGGNASNFFLYLYAQKANYPESSDAYDNVQIYKLASSGKTLRYELPQPQTVPTKILLKKGVTHFSTDLSLESHNLVDNANFSAGLWQSQPQNCSDQTGIDGVAMRPASYLGKSAIDLSTDGFVTACTNSAFISGYGQSNTYLMVVTFRIVNGGGGRICAWNGKECITSKDLLAHDHSWHTQNILVSSANNTQPLSVYLYAPAGTKTEVQYTDVSIYQIGNSFLDDYNLQTTNSHLITSAKVNFQAINPTRYDVHITAKGSDYIVFSQSYHPDWRAYIVERQPHGILENIAWSLGVWKRHEIPSRQHTVANGYANAWWLTKNDYKGYADANGHYEMLIDYAPQSFVVIGLMLSSSVTVVCIAYIIQTKRKPSIIKKTKVNKQNVV